MVIYDFDLLRPVFAPDEADPPLVVDPDAVLTATGARERFEPIARRNPEVSHNPCLVQQTQFSQGGILNVGRQFSASPSGPDQLCLGVRKALDHVRV